MKKEKRRPSLEELQQMPRVGLELELAYIAERAREVGSQVEAEAAALIASETLEAQDIIRLREELQRNDAEGGAQ